MPNPQSHRAIIAVLVVALVAVMVGLVNTHRAASTPIVINPPGGAANMAASVPPAPVPLSPPPAVATPNLPAPGLVPAPKPTLKAPALIYVHVAGAVKRPSLYQLSPDSRVWHAIKAAGGPTASADENAVNLAAKIHDGQKIFVPTKAAAVEAASAPREAAFVPAPTSAPVTVKTARAPASAKGGKGAKDMGAGKPAKLVSASQGQVNINTAGAEQLQELPGIGPAMAGRIVGYRQQTGGFQKAEDLMSVGGIGPKKFARIAPLIKLH